MTRTARGAADLGEQLGRMAEALENGKEDRNEMRADLRALSANVSDLKSSVNELTQTMRSTSVQITAVATEKCGERLDTMEARALGVDFQDLVRGVADYRKLKERFVRYVIVAAIGTLLAGGVGGAALYQTAKTAIIASAGQ